jgi:hypothetical protein
MTSSIWRRFACITMSSAALALAGCAANVVKAPSPGADTVRVPTSASQQLVVAISGVPQVVRSSDWAAFRGELRGAIAAEASAKSLPFSMQDGEGAPTGQPGTLMLVNVKDYRYVTTGARMGFGIFTGNAFLDATVRYVDLKDGRSFGEQSVNTSSSAWQGVFSAMTEQQLRAVAKELVNDVKP